MFFCFWFASVCQYMLSHIAMPQTFSSNCTCCVSMSTGQFSMQNSVRRIFILLKLMFQYEFDMYKLIAWTMGNMFFVIFVTIYDAQIRPTCNCTDLYLKLQRTLVLIDASVNYFDIYRLFEWTTGNMFLPRVVTICDAQIRPNKCNSYANGRHTL